MDEEKPLVTRRLLATARQRMDEAPVLLLEGPRTVGKSTLLRQLAGPDGTVIDLDDPDVRQVVRDDPVTWVRQSGPVFIDEYQFIPEVLDVIKSQLNSSSRPGQFVLTGSSHFDSLPRAAQSLTGRLQRLEVLPLAECELRQTTGLLPQLADAEAMLSSRVSETSRTEYMDLALQGGFPLALAAADGGPRNRWFDQYVNLTLQRDVGQLATLRQGRLLPRVLEQAAGQTAQIVNVSHIARSVDLSPTTVSDYLRLLEAVFLLRLLPPWEKTLSSKAARSPKLHIVDSGVAARLLRLSSRKLEQLDPTAQTEFGHLMETFAVSELLKEVSWTEWVSNYGHWRTRDDLEVDLVLEDDSGGIFAFEIKASARIPSGGFRPLAKLREMAGSAFRLGVVLYLGTRAYRHDDQLIALPMDRLWAGIDSRTK